MAELNIDRSKFETFMRAFSSALINNAEAKSQGYCARYVAIAFNEGLKAIGEKQISRDNANRIINCFMSSKFFRDNYNIVPVSNASVSQLGVLANYPGAIGIMNEGGSAKGKMYGHIQATAENGRFYSDFAQRSFNVYGANYTNFSGFLLIPKISMPVVPTGLFTSSNFNMVAGNFKKYGFSSAFQFGAAVFTELAGGMINKESDQLGFVDPREEIIEFKDGNGETQYKLSDSLTKKISESPQNFQLVRRLMSDPQEFQKVLKSFKESLSVKEFNISTYAVVDKSTEQKKTKVVKQSEGFFAKV